MWAVSLVISAWYVDMRSIHDDEVRKWESPAPRNTSALTTDSSISNVPSCEFTALFLYTTSVRAVSYTHLTLPTILLV